VVDGEGRVVGMLDALEHDRQRGAFAQEGQVVPGEGGSGEHLEERLDGGARLGGAE
jgi:hypothetical protein